MKSSILVRERHRGEAEKKLVTLRRGGRKRGGGEGERELEEQKRERQKSYRGKLVDIPRLYRPAE